MLQQRPRGLGQRRFLPAHPRQAQRVADEIAAAVGMAADPDVVEHRLRAEQREVLEGAGDADLGDAVRRAGEHRAAFEQDIAAIGRVEPADAVEQRGLAGAVRPDQPEDLALLDGERDAVERDDAAEAQSDVADFEQRRAPDGRAGRARAAAPPALATARRRCRNPHGPCMRAFPQSSPERSRREPAGGSRQVKAVSRPVRVVLPLIDRQAKSGIIGCRYEPQPTAAPVPARPRAPPGPDQNRRSRRSI